MPPLLAQKAYLAYLLADAARSRAPVQEGEDLAADAHQFVSSVCWSHKGHTLLAANSQGTLKLLELD
jgi:hypothetical protein